MIMLKTFIKHEDTIYTEHTDSYPLTLSSTLYLPSFIEENRMLNQCCGHSPSPWLRVHFSRLSISFEMLTVWHNNGVSIRILPPASYLQGAMAVVRRTVTYVVNLKLIL